jgi:hypothetical protein
VASFLGKAPFTPSYNEVVTYKTPHANRSLQETMWWCDKCVSTELSRPYYDGRPTECQRLMLQHVSIPIVHHCAEIAGRMQASAATFNTSHAYKCVDLTCMHYVICRGVTCGAISEWRYLVKYESNERVHVTYQNTRSFSVPLTFRALLRLNRV